MIATVSHDRDLAIAHRGNTLQQKMRRVSRIAHHDDLTDAWLPTRRENEEPISLPQRRLHAVAGDGHAPRTSSHFFVA
jgi:hypothetical protein